MARRSRKAPTTRWPTNNIEPGTATVTVTGAGKYSGTASAAFTIKAGEPGSTLDKSKLQALVDKVKGYNKADYQSGWDARRRARQCAAGVASSADQQEVDKALSQLQSAADKLVKRSGGPARPTARTTVPKSPPPSRTALCPTPAPRYSVWVSPRSHCSPPPVPPTPSASARPELLAA